MKKLLSAVAVASLMTGAAFAAKVESDAGAKIVAPLQISNVTALYFGTVAPSLKGQTVRIAYVSSDPARPGTIAEITTAVN